MYGVSITIGNKLFDTGGYFLNRHVVWLVGLFIQAPKPNFTSIHHVS